MDILRKAVLSISIATLLCGVVLESIAIFYIGAVVWELFSGSSPNTLVIANFLLAGFGVVTIAVILASRVGFCGNKHIRHYFAFTMGASTVLVCSLVVIALLVSLPDLFS